MEIVLQTFSIIVAFYLNHVLCVHTQSKFSNVKLPFDLASQKKFLSDLTSLNIIMGLAGGAYLVISIMYQKY